MVLFNNSVNANDSTSSRLLTSTNVTDVSNIEVAGVRAIVRDHVFNDSNVSTVTVPTLTGTLGNATYDICGHNMINQNTFGTQVHVIQSVYSSADASAVEQSVDVGPFTGDTISLLDTTTPLIGGVVTVDISDGANADEVYALTASGETTDSSFQITFTGTDASNLVQKLALSSASNNNTETRLLETSEDAANASLLTIPTAVSQKYTISIGDGHSLASVEADNAYGTYGIVVEFASENIVHTEGNNASIEDICGDTPLVISNADLTTILGGTTVQDHFLPPSLLTSDNVVVDGSGISTYSIILDVSDAGNVTVASNDISFAVSSTLGTDLCANEALMDVLQANNVSDVTAVDSTSITYSLTNAEIGFGAGKTSSVQSGSNTLFTATLSTDQNELLSTNETGLLKLIVDASNARASRNAGDASIFTGLNVAFQGETSSNGTLDASASVATDVCYNIALVLADVSNTNYDVDSNIVVNGFVNDNSFSTIVLKDASSILIDASDVIASDVNMNAFMTDANTALALVKVEFQEVFAGKTRQLDVLNDAGAVTSSLANSAFQLQVTGTNVDLDEITGTPFDRVQLFLVPRSLNDLSNSLTLSNSVYDITNNAGGANETTPIVLSQDLDSRLDGGFHELYDTTLHTTSDTMDLKFKVVPSIVGKRFGTYILQEIDSSDSNIGTYEKYLFPSTSDISENSSSSSSENVTVSGLSNSSFTVTKTTTTANKDITVDFEVGVYRDLKIKLKGVQDVDVEYKVFDGSTQLPDINLSGVTDASSNDLYQNIRSRTTTFNGESFVQPSSGSVSDGNANLTFTLSRNILNSLKGQLQGRDPDALTYSSSESYNTFDAFYGSNKTVTGFSTDTNASFVIKLAADDATVLNNADGYRIEFDLQRGNIDTFTVQQQTLTATQVNSTYSKLTTPQELFDEFSGAVSDLSFNLVVDPSNVLTLFKNDVSFAQFHTNEKSLLGDLMLVSTRGSIFKPEVVEDGTTTSLSPVVLGKDDTEVKIDEGVVAAIDDTNIAFNAADATWKLLNAHLQILFDGTYDASTDVSGRITTLAHTNTTHQDITFSAFRGITATEDVNINRTVGSVDFKLVQGDLSSNSSHDLLVNNDMVLNFSGGDVSTNVANTGIVVEQTGFSFINDTSFVDVSSGNLIITPATYQITETFTFDVSSASITDTDLILNNLTPTSFNNVLLDFYDRPSATNASETNPYTYSIFAPNKIAIDADESLRIAAGGVAITITNPAQDASFSITDNAETQTIPNSPLEILKIASGTVDASFTLARPSQTITYRTTTGVDSSVIDVSTNIVTETFDISLANYPLASADISFTLPIRDLDEYETVDTNVYKIDMNDFSNKITASIGYSNAQISTESLVSNSRLSDLSAGASFGSFLISHAQNPNNVGGGSILTNYDISVNSGSNIFLEMTHGFVDPGTYTFTLPEFNAVTTSLIGAHYVLNGANPEVQIRKYSSPRHAPFENFTLNSDGFKAVSFMVDKVEQATFAITDPTFGTSAFNFNTSLTNLAADISQVNFTTVAFDTISGETAVHNATAKTLEYVLVSLDYEGTGNAVELLSVDSTTPVKSLIVETPDISRMLSADGSPFFRVRANGIIDAPDMNSTDPLNPFARAPDYTNPTTTVLSEYVAYNSLITKPDVSINQVDAKFIAGGNVSNTEFDFLNGVTSAIQTQLDTKATSADAALTGTPTAPTASAGTNTTQIATTAYVSTAVSNLVDSAPGTLDTLNEIAAAMNDDASFGVTIQTQITDLSNNKQDNISLTASRALVSDGTGNLAVSDNVTSTELGYLDGVTSAIQSQLDAKEDTISLTASRALVSDGTGNLIVSAVTSTELGYLANVSSAIQTQITDLSNNKQDNISLTASRALVSDTSGNLAVSDNVTSTELGYLDGVTSALQTQLDTKATSADAALTGTPTAPTASAGTNTTQIATTAYVTSAVDALVDSAPGTLDTLNEIAAALNDDASFGVTIQTQITDLSSNKQDNISLTASRALVSDGTGNLAVSDNVTSTELGYLDGVTSAIQTQLDGKQATLTFGIADTNAVRIDSTTVADGSFVLFTANGIESIDASNMTFALFDQTDISDVPTLVSSALDGVDPAEGDFNNLRQDVQNLKSTVNTLMGLLNTANIITRQT